VQNIIIAIYVKLSRHAIPPALLVHENYENLICHIC